MPLCDGATTVSGLTQVEVSILVLVDAALRQNRRGDRVHNQLVFQSLF